jgi:hypothetical protein
MTLSVLIVHIAKNSKFFCNGLMSNEVENLLRQESDHEWRMANGIGKYIFYNKILGREGRLALHPHYEALLNIFVQKELVAALDIMSEIL